MSKGNGALLAAVNLAIAAAKEDGSMDKFVAEANTLAEGNTYEIADFSRRNGERSLHVC